ncbi:MAG: hypothetical protein JKY08_08015 [Flavobacteriaceae bacterium]|nr:hypothetical protein [Flavobacteriaceae bacterium]
MKLFINSVLFIIISSFTLTLGFVYLYEDHAFVVLGAGVPASIMASILFLIINYYKFQKNNKMKLVFKALILIALYILISLIMIKGGDVLFWVQRKWGLV